MEIVNKINVPVDFFYQTIVNSVLADVHSQTGEKISEEQLQGFEYVKTFSKNAKATIQIEEITKNKFYQYRTSSTKNNFLVTYDIRPLTEDSCELHYSEKMESYGGFLQKVNDAFVGVVWSWLKKRKYKEMLRQIEASYSNKGVAG
ncbi:DUF3284 domain-containing protein [Amphibacillus sp. Q70]|uniref:DUF3284 domain-containing protein n=1 Tax=Amphibacillus sp. Q70 TaxID=3453416 RepID=UPI003F86F08D